MIMPYQSAVGLLLSALKRHTFAISLRSQLTSALENSTIKETTEVTGLYAFLFRLKSF